MCKKCNNTNETYCEYSCTVDNGGCPEGSQCSEVAVPTCNPGQCCSRINVTCSGNCIICKSLCLMPTGIHLPSIRSFVHRICKFKNIQIKQPIQPTKAIK